VLIPATTLLGPEDLADRVVRGDARHVVTTAADAGKFDAVPGRYTRIAVGRPVDGWLDYGAADAAPEEFAPDGPTRADDPLLLYFTSGTTAQPKLVEHSHASYPAGHLSTMYWIGIRPGDVHLNVSSPGWAKHAWSNVYAPWNAEATVLIVNQARFDAAGLLDQMVRCDVTTFCAPPTVWRMLIQEDLARWQVPARELVAAGEPLNPEVVVTWQQAVGVSVHDGYGQTETGHLTGMPIGPPVRPGSMGRPLPGFRAWIDEGELVIDPATVPTFFIDGDPAQPWRTGDRVAEDEDGYLWFEGRTDDVIISAGYRIGPFEVESALVAHPAVAEAAAVAAPDELRGQVVRAVVVLQPGNEPSDALARELQDHVKEQTAPYKYPRIVDFAEALPKTPSGKIRRAQLRSG
jgi:acetyl-CoA synthetase